MVADFVLALFRWINGPYVNLSYTAGFLFPPQGKDEAKLFF